MLEAKAVDQGTYLHKTFVHAALEADRLGDDVAELALLRFLERERTDLHLLGDPRVGLADLAKLTFLGGAFYSISMLPSKWQVIARFNPVVYLISLSSAVSAWVGVVPS